MLGISRQGVDYHLSLIKDRLDCEKRRVIDPNTGRQLCLKHYSWRAARSLAFA